MKIEFPVPLILVLILSLNILNPFFPANFKKSAEVGYPKKIESDSLGLSLSAKSALVVDLKSDKILFSKNKEEVLPIASITKLMSILVLLDLNIDWDMEVETLRGDRIEGGRIYLGPGEVATVENLINLSLVASDNQAVMSLVRASGFSTDDFVRLMNEKAGEMGMANTAFFDPTGIDSRNASTVYDLTRLARRVFSNSKIVEILELEEYSFSEKKNNIPHRVFSTDWLLGGFLKNNDDYALEAGKTGYLPEAGYCFLSQAKNKEDQRIITVILGSDTPISRFQETKGLIIWSFNNWAWIK